MQSMKPKKMRVDDSGVAMSWMQKKAVEDREAQLLQREVDHLFSWVTAIENMEDLQRREYVLAQTKPKTPKPKQARKNVRTGMLQVQKTAKSKQSKCSSTSLMAAVWKFHTEEDDQTPSLAAPLGIH